MKEYEGELKALRQEMDVQVGAARCGCCALWVCCQWVGSGGGHLPGSRHSMGASPPPHLFLIVLPVACTGCILYRLSVLQRQILDKLREAEKGVDKEVEEVIAERRRCRELMVSQCARQLHACCRAGLPRWCLGHCCRCSAGPCCSALLCYALRCCDVHQLSCVPSLGVLPLCCLACACSGLPPLPSLPRQEQAYGRLTGMKKEQRSKNNIFYSNRSFSRDVRKVRRDGGLGWAGLGLKQIGGRGRGCSSRAGGRAGCLAAC